MIFPCNTFEVRSRTGGELRTCLYMQEGRSTEFMFLFGVLLEGHSAPPSAVVRTPLAILPRCSRSPRLRCLPSDQIEPRGCHVGRTLVTLLHHTAHVFASVIRPNHLPRCANAPPLAMHRE